MTNRNDSGNDSRSVEARLAEYGVALGEALAARPLSVAATGAGVMSAPRPRPAWFSVAAVALVAVAGATLAVVRWGDATPTDRAAPAPAVSVSAPPTDSGASPWSDAAPTPLDLAMIPDDDVWIVNASGIPGHAGSLAEALGEAGYPVRELSTSAGDLPTRQTVIYVDPGADAAATVNELLAVLPGATHEDLPADGIAIIDGAEAARADLVVVLGSDQAHEPWLEPTSPLHQAPTGVLAVVDAAVTPDGHDEVAAQADTLREDGVDVAGVYPAATSISEELLMPIETSNRWTFAVAELVGIDGFDTWTPSFVDEPLPADVTAVVVLLGGDSVPEPTVAGSAVELPPQSAPGERPTLTTDCPDDSAATYIVERGDSLASIADELDVDLGDLLAANDLTPDSPLLAAGDCLVVP